MLVLRCNDCAIGVKHNDPTKKIYRIWFDLDARHETYISVSEDDKYEEILNRINTICDRWCGK